MGIVASAASFPYLFYQSMGPWSASIARDWGVTGEAGTIFVFQFTLLAAVVFICSITGVFLAERYNLPGFGKPRDVYNIVYRYGAPTLLFGMIAGWLLHDHTFFKVVPLDTGIYLYPRKILWSATLLLHNSGANELVFRFGVLTLAAGLFRGKHHYLAVFLTSFFITVLSIRELHFVDYARMDARVWCCVIWSLLSNVMLGVVYVRKGLWAAMSLRACLDARFLLYPVLGMV